MTRVSSSEAAGAWSQESREGLRTEAARSAAVATARGGQWRWAVQRGSAGSAAPAARAWTRVRRASSSPWSGRGSPRASRRRAATSVGPPAGRGPSRVAAPAVSASRTVVSSGRRVLGPWGPHASGLMVRPPGRGAGTSSVSVFGVACAESAVISTRKGYWRLAPPSPAGWLGPVDNVRVGRGWSRSSPRPSKQAVRGARVRNGPCLPERQAVRRAPAESGPRCPEDQWPAAGRARVRRRAPRPRNNRGARPVDQSLSSMPLVLATPLPGRPVGL